jgi:hypothetical protein
VCFPLCGLSANPLWFASSDTLLPGQITHGWAGSEELSIKISSHTVMMALTVLDSKEDMKERREYARIVERR